MHRLSQNNKNVFPNTIRAYLEARQARRHERKNLRDRSPHEILNCSSEYRGLIHHRHILAALSESPNK